MSDENVPRIQVPKVLADLVTEIQQADPEMFPPVDSIAPNEIPYRVLEGHFLRQLFAIQTIYRRDSMRAHVDSTFSNDPEEKLRAQRLEAKAVMFRSWFWYLVRDKYDWWEDAVGIREGWMLVSHKPEKNPFKALFGGNFPGE